MHGGGSGSVSRKSDRSTRIFKSLGVELGIFKHSGEVFVKKSSLVMFLINLCAMT